MREFTYYQDLMLGPAAKEIKALGLHGFFYEKWKDLSDQYTVEEKKTQVRSAVLSTLSTTLSTLASVGPTSLPSS